jgi:hypothetical protein
MKLRSSVYGWKSVWMDIADELKGEFVDGTSVVTAKLPIEAKPWQVTMQMHSNALGKASETTVIAVPYLARDPFKFALRSSSTAEEMAKVLGLQDIVIGNSEFDKAFIIQGTNPQQVKEFFGNAQLRDKILSQKSINLSIVDHNHKHFGIKPPVGHNVLLFVEKGAINSFERLTSLHELMIQSLERLCHIEAASEDKPHYVL